MTCPRSSHVCWSRVKRFLAAIVLFGPVIPPAWSQANYIELFDNNGAVSQGQGPENLINDGWIFRNQSEPVGAINWFDGSVFLFSPQGGPGFLGVDSSSTDFFGGLISTWAILPAIPGLVAGDELTVYLRAVTSNNHDTMQIRYSPTGGTNTGSSGTDVGDFDQLLADVNPIETSGWVPVSVPVPGNGRLALRYFVESACNFACASSSIGIDTLSVGPPPPPPCNLPPLPSSGEQVIWTAAGGPYQVCSDLVIPTNSSVTIEAGTTIMIDADRTLAVDGELLVNGTQGNPVVFDGGISLVTPPIQVFGTAELHHANIDCRIHAESGGTVFMNDCALTSEGIVSSQESTVGHEPPYLLLDSCDFDGGGIAVNDAVLSVENSSFQNCSVSLLRGHLRVNNLTIDGGQLHVIREHFGQPTVLDNLDISNFTSGAGIELWGYTTWLGPNLTLLNNLYPVTLTGGLVPGSQVPAAGNLNNYVDVLDGGIRGNATWPLVGVPYVVDGFSEVIGATLTIEPGVRVELTQGSGLAYSASGELRAHGLPDQPVTFAAHTPGSLWSQILFQSNSAGPSLRYSLLEDAEFGLHIDDSYIYVEQCQFQSNERGILATTFGTAHVRGSLFTNNVVGLETSTGVISHGSANLDGATNPNLFEGNSLAIESGNSSPLDATNNWWGDASGPQHPLNPSGKGDAIGGLSPAAVEILPFRQERPDLLDTPPLVRILPMAPMLETGSKVIVHWEAADDSNIVQQQILFSEHGNVGFELLADDLEVQARSHTIVVPTVNPSSDLSPTTLRVLVTDDQGQQGWDEVSFFVPYLEDVVGTLIPDPALTGTFRAGQALDVCWTVADGASGTISAFVLLDGDRGSDSLGGAHTGVDCLSIAKLPYLSTDMARIVMILNHGAGGRNQWIFSDQFSIRFDTLLDDTPPTVEMITPLAGAEFAAGATIPIQWTATDDDGIRSIELQASYNGGKTWHFIQEDLPAARQRYLWSLPENTGRMDLRIRVIARDLAFQSSSDGQDTLISVHPRATPHRSRY